jgi:hypothetical protein
MTHEERGTAIVQRAPRLRECSPDELVAQMEKIHERDIVRLMVHSMFGDRITLEGLIDNWLSSATSGSNRFGAEASPALPSASKSAAGASRSSRRSQQQQQQQSQAPPALPGSSARPEEIRDLFLNIWVHAPRLIVSGSRSPLVSLLGGETMFVPISLVPRLACAALHEIARRFSVPEGDQSDTRAKLAPGSPFETISCDDAHISSSYAGFAHDRLLDALLPRLDITRCLISHTIHLDADRRITFVNAIGSAIERLVAEQSDDAAVRVRQLRAMRNVLKEASFTLDQLAEIEV